ncbi:hypothetical protein [Arthrobacter castelli]|uniref:hypothetical protein n=1 Tax=Arthrobacter castelli TaxID=271431 RepID=UPI0003FE10AF|nr:hypothetical protein [Arthrobacter castelli]
MSSEQPEPAADGGTDPSAWVQEDLNKLMGTALGMAQEQLEDQGAFLPAALVVGNDGGIRMVAVSPANDDEDVDADMMINDLYKVLGEQRSEHRAVAVVSDVHLPDEATDAIFVATEHSQGVAVAAVQAYSQQEDSSWTFAEPQWEGAGRQVWED